MRVKLLRDIIVEGRPHKAGEVVNVKNEADAKILVLDRSAAFPNEDEPVKKRR